MNLAQWYKSIIESGREIPPEKVWEEIQNELDIDLVWSRVDEEMGRQRAKKRMNVFALAASFFLVIALGGIMFYLINTRRYDSSGLSEQVPVSEEYNDIIATDKPGGIEPSTTLATAVPEKVPVTEPVPAPYDPEEFPREETFAGHDLMKPVSPLLSQSIPLNGELTEVPVRYKVKPEPVVNETTVKPFSSLYIGLSGQLANTWLMNNKTLRGMKRTEFTATHPSFGKSFGLMLGSNLTGRLDFQTEFFLITQNRQNYNEYLYGRYVSNKLELDYYTMSFRVKYQLKNQGLSHRLTGGGYIGYMKNATRDIQ